LKYWGLVYLTAVISHSWMVCLTYNTRQKFDVQREMYLLDKVHSESRCALTKGVGSDVHEHLYMGLNPFNFIRKHFLQICLWDVPYKHSYCSFKLIKRAWVITVHCRFCCSPIDLSVQKLSKRTLQPVSVSKRKKISSTFNTLSLSQSLYCRHVKHAALCKHTCGPHKGYCNLII
jgi:hypothetical protein